MKIHQIWIGGELPEREAAWVKAIKSAAEAAGHEHRLWSWWDLREAYGGEEPAGVFARAMEALPGGTVAAFICDYYRWRVLADEGGLYLDTDFVLHGGWPELPVERHVYGMSEFYNEALMCSGILLGNGEEGARAFRLAAELGARHIMRQIKAEQTDFESRLVAMIRGGGLLTHGCGPAWLRKELLPAWEAAGVTWGRLPREAAGHVQWRSGGEAVSALEHVGTALWHKDRYERTDYWEKQAAAAAAIAATRRMDILTRAHARAREELEERPAWLRPGTRSILPRARRRRRADDTRALPLKDGLNLPCEVRRVIVFSNITKGFSVEEVGLRAGDLCLHVNRARHFEEARKVEGTMHLLIVRARASVRTEWFSPPSTNGFERVWYARSIAELPGMSWLREYAGKNPSTGFVAANMARTLWPHLPIILAGFDPEGDHGTYRWPGHDWSAEARWYEARGFFMLRPGGKRRVRVHVLINSCWQVDRGSLARAKNARNQTEKAARRQACRDTWLAKLPEGVTYSFVLGRAPAGVEPREDELCTPFDDSLQALGSRAAWALRNAVKNGEWEWLVRTDDDDYIDLPALVNRLAYRAQDKSIEGMRCGAAGLGNMLAGVCQVISRAAAEEVAADLAYPSPTHEDDLDLTRAVLRAGGSVRMPEELQARPRPGALTGGRLSAYWLRPEEMHAMHRGVTCGWVAPIFTGGRLGNLLFELAAAYAHALRHGLQCFVPWGQYAAVSEMRQILNATLPAIEPGSYNRGYYYKEFTFKPLPAHVRGGMRGYFQSVRYFEDQEPAIRDLYSPLIGSREPGTLGVHIRLGDYKLKPELYWVMTAEWLRRALQHTRNKHIILFYSDGKQEALSILKEALSGEQGYSVEIQHAGTAEDLRRLSAMEELIISASTFSWWGAWLGRVEHVIAPVTWFSGTIQNYQHLYLPHWLRL